MSYYSFSNSLTDYIAILRDFIDQRIKNTLQREPTQHFSFSKLKIEVNDSPIGKFIIKYELTIEEFVIVLLSLAPHIQPNFLDSVVQNNHPNGGDFPEIGGVKGNNHRGTLPTGETALFIIAGNDINKRIQASQYFSSDHFFAKENILRLETLKDGEPRMSGKIILQEEYVDLFTTGVVSKPSFGPSFPAKLITTRQNWNDAVLPSATHSHLKDLYAWLQHNETALKDPVLSRKIKPGYRALFYGPSGTGKTLVATLLGQEFKKDVYRVDLSQVVSKYIGETEKNLESVFERAENKDWILFFDEADALFGKRSNVQSAHDKYANQEVSYLLQRVEDFPRLVILASNFKSNIDHAFLRRFNSIIEFPLPGPQERLLLWQKAMPETIKASEDTDLKYFADKYELTGSSINQVVHYAVLQMHYKNEGCIRRELLLEGIAKELKKEDKLLR